MYIIYNMYNIILHKIMYYKCFMAIQLRSKISLIKNGHILK